MSDNPSLSINMSIILVLVLICLYNTSLSIRLWQGNVSDNTSLSIHLNHINTISTIPYGQPHMMYTSNENAPSQVQ